jgi:A/G-specific adenine glycosylase
VTDTELARIETRITRLRAKLHASGPTAANIRAFRSFVHSFYATHGRDLPWRATRDPYRILVSEIMLQQTQVPRVIVKYREFLDAFPDIGSLARAPTKRLLEVWQGMGYNRRAIALQRTAHVVCDEHGGRLPRTVDELVSLPGIGPATAADIMAFAYDQPAVVIETNIRAVFIYLFFADGATVHDRDVRPLVERTLDRKRPRDWYNALMDLGVFVKSRYGNPAKRSAHHVRQSKFEGSNRQLRSKILKLLLTLGPSTAASVTKHLAAPADAVVENLKRMCSEGLLCRSGKRYTVA